MSDPGSGQAPPGAPCDGRRLTATMRSRKLQALDFIKRYFAMFGHSPSYDEIAAALGVSKQRAAELVARLSAEAQIERVAGKVRSIGLPGRGAELSEADVLLRLKELGWAIAGDARTVTAPLTEKRLTELPFLDHE